MKFPGVLDRAYAVPKDLAIIGFDDTEPVYVSSAEPADSWVD
jgi:DNA-binding LacI/PurR family transcriptional regulator